MDGETNDELNEDSEGRLAYRPAELAGSVGMSAKAVYRAIGRGELRAVRVCQRHSSPDPGRLRSRVAPR